MRPTFVKQAQLINDELIRCAILWHEQWHEALEDASRFYFQVSEYCAKTVGLSLTQIAL